MPTYWKATWSALGVSFIGLALVGFAEKGSWLVEWLIWTLSGVWLLALLVGVPLCVCLDRRQIAEKDMSRYRWWQWLLLIPYWVGDANAKVPGWIAYPLMFTGLLLGMGIIGILSLLLIQELLN